jgi:hypothetical protein
LKEGQQTPTPTWIANPPAIQIVESDLKTASRVLV